MYFPYLQPVVKSFLCYFVEIDQLYFYPNHSEARGVAYVRDILSKLVAIIYHQYVEDH